MNAVTNREALEVLEAAIGSMPQVDVQTQHHLSGGMYARTIFIPAGSVIVGTTHKTDHINVMIGDIEVSTDHGMVRLTGYNVLETKAGMKRHGYAYADTYWTTVCKTANTDLEAIENELVEEPERLQTRRLALTKGEALCLGQQ